MDNNTIQKNIMAKNDLEQKRSRILVEKWEVLFERNPALKEKYQSFVDSYIDLMLKYEEALK